MKSSCVSSAVRRAPWEWIALLGFVALVAAGCGGATQREATTELDFLIVGLPDALRSPETFRDQFAADAAPPEADRAKYARFGYLIKSAYVSGDTATIDVEFKNRDDEILGQAEWTAVREQGTWKLKSAPLL